MRKFLRKLFPSKAQPKPDFEEPQSDPLPPELRDAFDEPVPPIPFGLIDRINNPRRYK